MNTVRNTLRKTATIRNGKTNVGDSPDEHTNKRVINRQDGGTIENDS